MTKITLSNDNKEKIQPLRLTIDRTPHNAKPKGVQIAEIVKGKAPEIIEASDLPELVEQGGSFTAAYLEGGTKKENWKEQRLIIADIDNEERDADGNKRPISDQLKPSEAEAILTEAGIGVYFMYYSFSASESWERFRIVLLLDEPITELEEAERATRRLCYLLNSKKPNCSDGSMWDATQLLFGGPSGCVEMCGNWEYSTTTKEKLLSLPKDPDEDQIVLLNKNFEDATEKLDQARRKAAEASNEIERMRAEREIRIRTFDLCGYLSRFSGSKRKRNRFVPCPICGRGSSSGGSFIVSGPVWKCFSANHGHETDHGFIIEYLMQKENLSLPEAMDRATFDADILGFDRDAWERASLEAFKTQKQLEEAADEVRFAEGLKEWKEAKKREEQKAEARPDETPAESEEGPTANEIAETMRKRFEALTPFSRDADFWERCQNSPDAIKTGFPSIDKFLGGGLYSGFYVMGAPPSVGKTALVLQIADNIAANGIPVLYFSLEMGADELTARSISRTTFFLDETGKDKHLNAKNGIQISNGNEWKYFTEPQKKLVEEARKVYTNGSGKNIYFFEGTERYTAKQIRQITEAFITAFKASPVVVIDYIQIVEADKKGLTDKQKIDEAALTIKRMSRDFNICVICISSVNREAYKKNNGLFSLSDLKESGILEFSADAVLGLQYADAGEKDFSEEANETKDPRTLDLVKGKNRNGTKRGKIPLLYYPAFNAFLQTDAHFRNAKPKDNVPDFSEKEDKEKDFSAFMRKRKDFNG